MRMHAGFVRISLSLVLGFGLLTPGPATGTSHPEAADPSVPTIADAIRVRTMLGMRADPAFVADTFRAAERFSKDPLGVPMDDVEAAEVERRIAVQLAADPVADWAEGSQPGYAGMYMDQARISGAQTFAFGVKD